MSVYDKKPTRFLERLFFEETGNPTQSICCAGFEIEAWRCEPFAKHLIEWLPEYALAEEELNVHHGNLYVRLQEAAFRIYTSENYSKRGECGEIAIHAICREFFQTLPISTRVFYKSSSNDVIKAFDLVHARIPPIGEIELWLGESKLYADTAAAIADAIASVSEHIEKGFLQAQKLILGPQIPKKTPRYDELMDLFRPQTSLDKFLSSAVFVVGILSNSKATGTAKRIDERYKAALGTELSKISQKLSASGLPAKIRIALLYVPLADKEALVAEFDRKLKGLQ